MTDEITTWYELQAHKQYGGDWKLQGNEVHTGSILTDGTRRIAVVGTMVKPAEFKELSDAA